MVIFFVPGRVIVHNLALVITSPDPRQGVVSIPSDLLDKGACTCVSIHAANLDGHFLCTWQSNCSQSGISDNTRVVSIPSDLLDEMSG
jgi:hypothetical protein